MKVQFLDLKQQHKILNKEINIELYSLIKEAAFSGGKYVEKFEVSFASYCKCRYCVGLGSGTEALWLALKAIGIVAGDEIITVPNTFIATIEAISICGAKPVFIDIDKNSYNMDPQKLLDYLKTRYKKNRNKIKAIIPVHMFGQMAEMDSLMEIAKSYNLKIVEDACQAHGATYNNKPAGSIGNVGCFSFYPGKNLGAWGEAGAVVTNDKEIAKKIRIMRDHGQKIKYQHIMIGWNARMDGIQGAVLNVKLKYLPKWIDERRKIALLYKNYLKDNEAIILPSEGKKEKHVYHIYAVRVNNRNKIMHKLKESGIVCGVHYPVPLHLSKAYSYLGYKRGSYPIAEKCAKQYISLPMYPELKNKEVEYVCRQFERLTKEQNI